MLVTISCALASRRVPERRRTTRRPLRLLRMMAWGSSVPCPLFAADGGETRVRFRRDYIVMLGPKKWDQCPSEGLHLHLSFCLALYGVRAHLGTQSCVF
jgi:hypothetical protein